MQQFFATPDQRINVQFLVTAFVFIFRQICRYFGVRFLQLILLLSEQLRGDLHDIFTAITITWKDQLFATQGQIT